MNFNLKEGQIHKIELIVSNNETAKFYGSGDLEVFATPAMIASMEMASKECVQADLPEGYSTVGIEVSVKHIKASPMGMKVTAVALLEKIDGNRLNFKVEAYDEKGKVGEGMHVRYIVNSEDFMNRLNK
jgi:fluoroacetyl-CoA thioesterase